MAKTLLSIALGLLAACAGASLVIQVALNAKLRLGLASWAWAGLVSYLGGTLAMLLVVVIQRPPWPTSATRGALPWFAWTGGLFGALYIVLAIVLLPRLGAASVVALVVTGQLLTSLAFDHFGLLGIVQHSITPPRIVGALFLIAGVVLVRL